MSCFARSAIHFPDPLPSSTWVVLPASVLTAWSVTNLSCFPVGSPLNDRRASTSALTYSILCFLYLASPSWRPSISFVVRSRASSTSSATGSPLSSFILMTSRHALAAMSSLSFLSSENSAAQSSPRQHLAVTAYPRLLRSPTLRTNEEGTAAPPRFHWRQRRKAFSVLALGLNFLLASISLSSALALSTASNVKLYPFIRAVPACTDFRGPSPLQNSVASATRPLLTKAFTT
mmetsp:Transcript_4792/g.9978  ORF Transcript_4792/g.9978 Transcript_4792/m.9978 type:complete len:233 (-) Transcript_4792:282-980(-)